MSEVGALIIRLQAETAQFRQDMGKVKSDLADVQNGAGGASAGFSKMAGATGGLRNQIGLLDNTMRGNIPMAMADMIRKFSDSAIVMNALPFAASIAGFVLVGEIVAKLAQKLMSLHEANLKLAEATHGVDDAFNKQDDALMALNEAYTGMTKGSMAEYLQKAKDLSNESLDMTSWTKKFTAVLDEQASKWTFLKAKVQDYYSFYVGEAVAAYMTVGEAMAFNFKAAKEEFDKMKSLYETNKVVGVSAYSANDAEKAIQSINLQIEKNKDLKTAVSSITAEIMKASNAYDAEMAAGHFLDAQRTKDAMDALALQKDAYIQQQQINSAKGRNENTQAANEAAQQQADLQKVVTAGVDAHEAALRKLAQTQAESSGVAVKSSQQEHDAAVDAARQELSSKFQLYQADVAAAGQNAAKKKELLQQYLNEEQAFDDAVAQADADLQKEKVEAARRALDKIVQNETKAAQVRLEVTKQSITAEESISNAAINQEKSAISNAESLGTISKKQALQASLAIITQERDAKIKALEEETKAQQAALQAQIAADKQGMAGNPQGSEAYLKYQDDLIEKQQKLASLQPQLQSQINATWTNAQTQIEKTNAELAKLTSSWQNYFTRMKVETQDLATTLRVSLQQSITQFNTQFSSAMSKSIVEGKNFGEAMRQIAAQFLESQIDVLIQWLMKQIEVHTIGRLLGAEDTSAQAAQIAAQKALAASLAGANAVASFSLAPWPIDMGAAAFGASMMASAASFEIGGKIPGSGAVPIIGHGGETVVTRALTDRVEQSEGRGKSGGDVHMHNNFSPQIHAMDADGVDRVLTKHGETFRRHVTSQIRQMNRGR